MPSFRGSAKLCMMSARFTSTNEQNRLGLVEHDPPLLCLDRDVTNVIMEFTQDQPFPDYHTLEASRHTF